jgi:hypothetical protein
VEYSPCIVHAPNSSQTVSKKSWLAKPVAISDVQFEETKEASFGPVKIVMFIWRVADNDLTAEMTERDVLSILARDNVYVAFHKTRRHEGERLITATQPKQPGHPNFTMGNLKGFTQMWLIDVTGANKNKRPTHRDVTATIHR